MHINYNNNLEKSKFILKKYYGYDSFRKGQFDVINSILSRKDVFCIMPTGAGKSLCYQIPALILEGITIVISPLISLMKDQVDSLNDMGINACYINSSQSISDINSIISSIKNNQIKIIYIAPERLALKKFTNIFRDILVSQVAIDEAHCVSEWGHDFRESYRNIKYFIKSLNYRPVVSAFTGTATLEVREDSINLLGIVSPYIYIGDINRVNLHINVFKEEDKLEKIQDIISKNNNDSGIIYCLSRKEVESLYYVLRDLGYSVCMYHGGLDDRLKILSQEDFLYERKLIMIATNAFGMGIDKSNIRFIIHSTISKNIESYYQEIGRSGRDGEISNCYLLYNREDIKRVEYLINKSINIKRREIALKKLQDMIDFSETDSCYMNYIVNYFTNKSINIFCGNCSNCLKNDNLKDYTKEAQIILSTVFRTREKYGISVICDIIRGISGPKIIRDNLKNITTFGIMKDYNVTFIKSIIKELINQNMVSIKEGTYSMLKLNDVSMDILLGKKTVKFIIDKQNKALDPKLFETLKSWRRERAIIEHIKPYIIFSDSTLIEISNACPKTVEELLNIHGVGQKKIEKYAVDILQIIKLNKN